MKITLSLNGIVYLARSTHATSRTKGIVMLFGAVLWGALLTLPLFSRAGTTCIHYNYTHQYDTS